MMKLPITTLLLFLFITASTYSQKSTNWSIDVFPLDVKAQVLFNSNSGFKWGLEGEVGINFSNYIFLAGSHFSNKLTLIRYQQRDQFDNEGYIGPFGLGVFARINNEGKIPLDLGLRTEMFVHYDDSDDDVATGAFYGGYVQAFQPIKLKDVNGVRKKKISLGIRMSMGVFKEYNLRELGIMTDLWFRFHL